LGDVGTWQSLSKLLKCAPRRAVKETRETGRDLTFWVLTMITREWSSVYFYQTFELHFSCQLCSNLVSSSGVKSTQIAVK
jgi:hypothetical protein